MQSATGDIVTFRTHYGCYVVSRLTVPLGYRLLSPLLLAQPHHMATVNPHMRSLPYTEDAALLGLPCVGCA